MVVETGKADGWRPVAEETKPVSLWWLVATNLAAKAEILRRRKRRAREAEILRIRKRRARRESSSIELCDELFEPHWLDGDPTRCDL